MNTLKHVYWFYKQILKVLNEMSRDHYHCNALKKNPSMYTWCLKWFNLLTPPPIKECLAYSDRTKNWNEWKWEIGATNQSQKGKSAGRPHKENIKLSSSKICVQNAKSYKGQICCTWKVIKWKFGARFVLNGILLWILKMYFLYVKADVIKILIRRTHTNESINCMRLDFI